MSFYAHILKKTKQTFKVEIFLKLKMWKSVKRRGVRKISVCGTVKLVLRDHCHERPPVLTDHAFLAEGPTFQYN